MTRLPAKSRPHTPTRAIEYIDPETGQVFDLVAWAARYGSRFRITEPLRARAPGAFRNKISERTKHHIGCPFHDEHTDQKLDFATFVVNAGDSTAPGKGFTIHCRHAHCAERDRLEFVRQMLSDGWLTVNDLTNPAYLEPEVDPAEAAVDELNERRAMVMVGGKALVLTDTDADGRPTFELSRASDVRLWYDNDVVWVGGKPVSKFDLWRKHPRRRQFGAVKFAPASPPGAAAGSFYTCGAGSPSSRTRTAVASSS
jgi:hypothetical protein